MKSVNGFR